MSSRVTLGVFILVDGVQCYLYMQVPYYKVYVVLLIKAYFRQASSSSSIGPRFITV